MDPMTLMALASAGGQAVGGLAQGALGVGQAIRANKLRKGAVMPQYSAPQAAQEALGSAYTAYMDPRLAAEGYFLDQIAGNHAAATRGAFGMGGSTAERMGAALQAGATSAASINQLAAQAAMQQERDRAALLSELGVMAGYQDRAWELNQYKPWQDRMQAAYREGNAANQNIMGMVQGLGGAAAMAGYGVGGMNQQQGSIPYRDTTPMQSRTPQVYNPYITPDMSVRDPYGSAGTMGSKQAPPVFNQAYTPPQRQPQVVDPKKGADLLNQLLMY